MLTSEISFIHTTFLILFKPSIYAPDYVSFTSLFHIGLCLFFPLFFIPFGCRQWWQQWQNWHWFQYSWCWCLGCSVMMMMMTSSTMTIISYCHVSLIPKIPYIVILYTPEPLDSLLFSLFRFVFIFLVCFSVLNVYQSDHMLLSDGTGMVSGLGWAEWANKCGWL